MKCEKCGDVINVKNVKFCPFCGEKVEIKEELAGYTRLQYFSFAGDDEFSGEWDKLKGMKANEFLSWLRQHPPVRYVYRIFGEWDDTSRRRKHRAIFLDISMVNGILESGGKIYCKKSKLSRQILDEIGRNAFFTQEECEAAIKAEIEKEEP